MNSEIEIIFENWIDAELRASTAGYPGSMSDLEIYIILDIAVKNPLYMENILKHHNAIML